MQTFLEWLARDVEPKPTRTPDQLIVPTIASFQNGLTRRELRQRFKNLDYKTFLGLLDAYVEIGQLSASREGDDVRYRVRAAMAI
jgi:hypothetical protein